MGMYEKKGGYFYWTNFKKRGNINSYLQMRKVLKQKTAFKRVVIHQTPCIF